MVEYPVAKSFGEMLFNFKNDIVEIVTELKRCWVTSQAKKQSPQY